MQRKLTKEDKSALAAIDGFMNEVKPMRELQTAKAWKSKVYASLVNWLGKDNQNTIDFYNCEGVQVLHHPHDFRPQSDYAIMSRLNQIKEYIKANGVVVEPKINWLYKADKKFLYGSFVAILGIVGSGGIMLGKFLKDKSELKLERDYEELVDSIRIVKLSLQITNNETQTVSSQKSDNKINVKNDSITKSKQDSLTHN